MGMCSVCNTRPLVALLVIALLLTLVEAAKYEKPYQPGKETCANVLERVCYQKMHHPIVVGNEKKGEFSTLINAKAGENIWRNVCMRGEIIVQSVVRETSRCPDGEEIVEICFRHNNKEIIQRYTGECYVPPAPPAPETEPGTEPQPEPEPEPYERLYYPWEVYICTENLKLSCEAHAKPQMLRIKELVMSNPNSRMDFSGYGMQMHLYHNYTFVSRDSGGYYYEYRIFYTYDMNGQEKDWAGILYNVTYNAMGVESLEQHYGYSWGEVPDTSTLGPNGVIMDVVYQPAEDERCMCQDYTYNSYRIFGCEGACCNRG
ncbi:MAG: hypothetical protein QXP42_03625 [Candidatus Micrarchaeia archaeon]